MPCRLSATCILMASFGLTLHAQEPPPKWDVHLIPSSPAVNSVLVPAEPLPEFEVLSSVSRKVHVRHAPEMSGLPPVEGEIKLTLQQVADPGLPEPTPAAPRSQASNPTALARLRQSTAARPPLVFVSATVYAAGPESTEVRSLMEIHPNGEVETRVVAWSNLNLLQLSPNQGYRVHFQDGDHQDVELMVLANAVYTSRVSPLTGLPSPVPAMPVLPDLAASGPAFSLVAGDPNSMAYAALEQIHALFRSTGATLAARHQARRAAQEQRRAWLLAHPPAPQDVTISVWRRTAPDSTK